MNGALVDTSVVVVGEPFADALPEPVSISVITIGELRAGVLRARDRTQAAASWDRVVSKSRAA